MSMKGVPKKMGALNVMGRKTEGRTMDAKKTMAREAGITTADKKKDTNPKDRAASDRLDLTLFPDSAIAYGALAFVEGDAKYGGFNWRVSGVQASVYVAAAKRHFAKWFNGEDCDPKSHVHHLANALACGAVLIDAIEHGNLNDDRPPRQNMGRLFSESETTVRHLRETFGREGSPPRATEKAAKKTPPRKSVKRQR